MWHNRVPLMSDNYDDSFGSAHFVQFITILDEDQGDSEPIRKTHRMMLMRMDTEGRKFLFYEGRRSAKDGGGSAH